MQHLQDNVQELSQHFAELKEKQPAVEISNWDKLDPAVRRQVALERVKAVLSRILGDGETSLEVPMRPSLQDVKFDPGSGIVPRADARTSLMRGNRLLVPPRSEHHEDPAAAGNTGDQQRTLLSS